MFALTDLAVPLVGAPMAGGPSTPQLAAAVSNAGGLGMLAAGYLNADQLLLQIEETKALTDCPFGINLFVPTPTDPAPQDAGEQLERFRQDIAPVAASLGAELPNGMPHDEAEQANFDALLATVQETQPACATFTFGCPSTEDIERLQSAGICVGVTVTNPQDAALATQRGADFLCVQGPDAGGHQSTFRVADAPNQKPLEKLLKSLTHVSALPLIAAGGIRTAAQVKELLSGGATAVQLGTPLLLADEAGTNATHRELLLSAPRPTVLTRAFTGRYARAITNTWTENFDDAPAIYPGLHQLTSSVRKAAAATGNLEWIHAWAGKNYSAIRTGSAAEILARFT